MDFGSTSAGRTVVVDSAGVVVAVDGGWVGEAAVLEPLVVVSTPPPEQEPVLPPPVPMPFP